MTLKDSLAFWIQKVQIREKLRRDREALGTLMAEILEDEKALKKPLPPSIEEEILSLAREIKVLKSVLKKLC